MGLQRVRSEGGTERIPEAEGDALEIEPPGLDLREIEDVVQEGKERAGGELHRFQALALLAVELRVQRDVRHPDDGVHRGADLVAHVGEELRFQASGLQRLVARLGRLGFGPLALDRDAAELRGRLDQCDLVVARPPCLAVVARERSQDLAACREDRLGPAGTQAVSPGEIAKRPP